MTPEPKTEDAGLEMAPEVDKEQQKQIDPSFVPCVLGICCDHSGCVAADQAGLLKLEYPSRVKLLRLPCLGRLDVIHILRAFEDGADGVFVVGCAMGECRFGAGNLRAQKRVEYTMQLLDEVGVGADRLGFYQMPASAGERFAEVAKQFTMFVRTLGQSQSKGKALKLADGTKAVSQLKLMEGAKQY